MPCEISAERPDSPDAQQLISELDALLAPLYSAESRHGFSVEKLLRDGVAFFVSRHDGVAAGCGGVLLVGTEYAEIKRMYVRPQFRGLGLSRLMLQRLSKYAVANGITCLRLETGIHQREAIALYESEGFHRILPFGPYFEDPVGLCFEKQVPEEVA